MCAVVSLHWLFSVFMLNEDEQDFSIDREVLCNCEVAHPITISEPLNLAIAYNSDWLDDRLSLTASTFKRLSPVSQKSW